MAIDRFALSPNDVVQASGFCRRNVDIAIQRGDLKSFKFGKRRAILPSDLAKWIAYLKECSEAGKPIAYQGRGATSQTRAKAKRRQPRDRLRT